MANNPQSIRSSSKWLVGSNVAGQIMQFGFGVATARLLVPADFGMIITVQLLTGFVGMFTSGGMGQAIVRSRQASEHDFQVVFSIQLLVSTIVFVILFIIAPWFAIMFNDPLYESLLRVSALNFLIRPLFNTHNAWLQREMRFKDTSITGIFVGLLSGSATIAMAMGGMGVWSLVLGGVIGSILGYLSISRLTPIKLALRFDRLIAKKHSSYGMKIVANDFIVYLRNQTTNLIITKIAGATMVGLFNKGDSLAKLPFSTISSPIYQPVFRSMAAEQNDPDKIKYLFLKMISLLMLYTLPLYVGLWWLAKPFIIVVYGEHWAEASVPLEILAPLGLLYCIGHPCGAVLAATNKLGREAVVQTITLIMVALFCYYGLKWGLTGVAFGIVISQIYSTTHMFYLANKSLHATFSELWSATSPALLLNSVLLLTLMVIDYSLPSGMRSNSMAKYLIIFIMGGGAVYIFTFLYFPLPALRPEALLWKKRLKLVAQSTRA